MKTGDLLAVVDPKPYQAALDQAKAQAALDEVTLKRQTDLKAKNVIASQDYDTAVANAKNRKPPRKLLRSLSIIAISSRRSTAARTYDLSTLATSSTLRT